MSKPDSTPSPGRKSISKKLRFEVFKRDSFTCQYCGRKAPDVILHVDHLHPQAKGGQNDILNLLTACIDCNAGKSDRLLSDQNVLEKQRKQLAELQERKEQMEMMYDWQKSLLDMGQQIGERLNQFWSECCPGWRLSDHGEWELRNYQRRFGFDEVMTAIQIAADYYLKYDDQGTVVKTSAENAWKKVGGILVIRQRERENPDFPLQRLYQLRAQLRGRFGYWDEGTGWRLLRDAARAGVSIETIEDIAADESVWTYWRQRMEDEINNHEDGLS